MRALAGGVAKLPAVAALLLSAPALAQQLENTTTRAPYSDLEQRSSVEETYVANAMSIVNLDLDSRFLFWSASASSWRPIRGDGGRQTSYEEFFRALGRHDLEKEYAERSGTGRWYLWGGLGVTVTGLGLGIYGLAASSTVPAVVGGGAFLGGLVLAQIGALMQEPQISAEDAARLVDSYNATLRIYLKLPDVGGAISFRGLSLSGRF